MDPKKLKSLTKTQATDKRLSYYSLTPMASGTSTPLKRSNSVKKELKPKKRAEE